MSARHLDIVRDLSAKSKDKEDQQRREEHRQEKRASSVRERILTSATKSSPESGGSSLPGLPQADPTASLKSGEPHGSQEEQRLWQIKCNQDIERRQTEVIQRLQEVQRLKSIKREREKLKSQWRAHKAKSYLLENCQSAETKAYLESKEKPKALPKIPSNTSAAASQKAARNKAADAAGEEKQEQQQQQQPSSDVSSGATLCHTSPETIAGGSRPSSSSQAPAAPSEAEETSSEAKIDEKKAAKLAAKQNGYISKFVSRMKTAQCNSSKSARDMADWKRRNCCPQDKKVFVCAGGYPDFIQAMLNRGWFQNQEKDSKFFDLKWAPAYGIDHESLLPSQVVNHFAGNREITTKVGLTTNLKNNCLPMCSADPDEFYPRAYDLYEPAERADFVTNFKFTKAQAVLRELLRTIESGAEWTFSQDVVSLASKICMRLITDVDDVLDCDEIAEGLHQVSSEEWALLEQVCLDDVTQRLECSLQSDDLDDFINKKQVPTAWEREKEQKEKQRQKEKEKQMKQEGILVVSDKPKKKKKKKVKNEDEEEVPLCTPTKTLQSSAKGKFLIDQARSILQELDGKSRQFGLNGCRNAWIVKPSGKSRGRGIKVMRELDEIFRNCEGEGFQWICQKYMERNHLIHGYKFDIRQWVLVTDWSPLTVYIWSQPYLRFAGQKYDETMADRSSFKHLVNNSIIKYMDGFDKVNEELQSLRYMWFRQQYEEWLHARYCTRQCHRTPFLKPPPYTCESFGVRWEDVAFTNEEDDEEEDNDAEPVAEVKPCPASAEDPVEASTSAGSSSPCSSTTEDGHTSSPPVEQQTQEASPTAEEASGGQEPTQAPSANMPGLGGTKVADDDDSVEPCENLWDTLIRPEMERVIVRSLMSVVDAGVQPRKGSVELFGYDFMIGESADAKPEVWLIEVNSSPACDYSTPVTCPLVKKVMEDTAKVMVDLAEDPEAATGEWELIQHEFKKPIPQRTGFVNASQLELTGKKLKLPKVPKKRKKSKRSPKSSGSGSEGEGGEDNEDDDEIG
eukprot:TRINITY_DN4553_c0_g1_i2.p1 TRINITY_DN4553_c0_g1~~TRINITY_DN4553_c0_g1_i2.p1  ORF type:complete len:1022 (+),score=279.90 TRINITY_DN4553_c0_g1_i2:314-3379(+)